MYEWQVYVIIYRGLSMEGNCKSDGTKSRENIIEYLQNLPVQQAILCDKGPPRRSSYENLESELVNSFYPNRRKIRVPEYRLRNKRL